MLFLFGLIVISSCISFAIFMFLNNKDVMAKIQIVNIINTLIIIFIAIYCYYINKPSYIDIAILYATINYVSMLAINRYFILNNKK